MDTGCFDQIHPCVFRFIENFFQKAMQTRNIFSSENVRRTHIFSVLEKI